MTLLAYSVVALAALAAIVANLNLPEPRYRWLRVFRTHAELCAFLMILILAVGWLGPNLDEYDRQQREARMAQR